MYLPRFSHFVVNVSCEKSVLPSKSQVPIPCVPQRILGKATSLVVPMFRNEEMEAVKYIRYRSI